MKNLIECNKNKYSHRGNIFQEIKDHVIEFAAKFKNPNIEIIFDNSGLKMNIFRCNNLISDIFWSIDEFNKYMPNVYKDHFRSDSALKKFTESCLHVLKLRNDFIPGKVYKNGGKMILANCLDYKELKSFNNVPCYYLLVENVGYSDKHWVFLDGELPQRHNPYVLAEVGNVMEKHVLTGIEVWKRVCDSKMLKSDRDYYEPLIVKNPTPGQYGPWEDKIKEERMHIALE